MFIGEFSYTIDQKKRIAIPSKFRKELGKKAVITRGLDNCLAVYPMEEWKKLTKKLEALPNIADRCARICQNYAVGSC